MEENNFLFFNSIAAFVIAILTGLGVGSGGLFVAYLTVIALPTTTDIRALNLLFFILSAAMATVVNIGARKFNLKLVFIMSAFGILGCLVGTGVANYISSDTVQKIFGGLLIFSGVYMLISGVRAKKPAKISKNRRIV